MDDDQSHNLQSIYTQIGMIMEDAALIALQLGGSKVERDHAKEPELEKAVNEINELMKVAQSIAE